jgi:antitoxin FitA
MKKMIQVRNVPESLHRKLKARAAMMGMSLSDYLLKEMREISERLTPEEMEELLRRRTRPDLPVSAARLVRAERDSR